MGLPDSTEPRLIAIGFNVCEPCLTGAGGECHVPGCTFWMHDAPIGSDIAWLRERRVLESPDCTCGHDKGWHSYAWDDEPEDGPACDFVDCVCGIYEPAEGGEVHQ